MRTWSSCNCIEVPNWTQKSKGCNRVASVEATTRPSTSRTPYRCARDASNCLVLSGGGNSLNCVGSSCSEYTGTSTSSPGARRSSYGRKNCQKALCTESPILQSLSTHVTPSHSRHPLRLAPATKASATSHAHSQSLYAPSLKTRTLRNEDQSTVDGNRILSDSPPAASPRSQPVADARNPRLPRGLEAGAPVASRPSRHPTRAASLPRRHSSRTRLAESEGQKAPHLQRALMPPGRYIPMW